MKILFVITGVNVGGAENMLLKLASGLSARFEPSVVTLEPITGGLADRYREAGIPLESLQMRGFTSIPSAVTTLARQIRRQRPDIVCTWLYQADLIGSLACRVAGHRALAWNIRNSDLDPTRVRASMRAVVKANARLTRWPQTILCCSEVARDIHVALGYDAGRFRIIPNGFDLSAFRPDPAARASVRAEFGIADDAPLIGMVARFDPQKDHRTFIEAAARLHARMPAARFLLVGKGCEPGNAELGEWIRDHGLGEAIRLAGRRDDIPRLTAALDVASLTSIYGEAFPNVLGEAMACGVPCVTTGIGDAAAIVDDTGRVVTPRKPDDLADAWASLLDLPAPARAALGSRARSRVATHYEIGEVRRLYERAFDAMVGAA